MNRRFLLESLLKKPILLKPTINVQYIGGGTNVRITFTNYSSPLGTMYYKVWEEGESEPSTYQTTLRSSVTEQFTLSPLIPYNTVHAKAYIVNVLGTSEITEI